MAWRAGSSFRISIRWISLWSLVLVMAACSRPVPKEPNVILITVDTLRCDHVHAYGNQRIDTPAMDSLARDGVLFEQSFSTFNQTSPSHASILTGLYATHHGVYTNTGTLPTFFSALQDVLKTQGYATAAAVSVQHISVSNLGRGFDQYMASADGSERIAADTISAAIDWLEHKSAQKFYLWVHLFDPHATYQPPPPYNTMYYQGIPRDPAKPSIYTTIPFLSTPPWGGIFKDWLLPITDPAYPPSQYMGEVSFVDAQLDRLLKRLKELEHYDDSLIVLTADHGESLGEQGVYYAHWGLGEANFRVPLILKFPVSQYRSTRVTGFAQGCDIFPTVLDYLGSALPGKVDGSSLMPLVRGEAAAIRDSLFMQSSFPGGAILRTSRWRLETRLDDQVRVEERAALYDMQADPGESRNLAGRERKIVGELERELLRHLSDQNPKAPDAFSGMDDATRARVWAQLKSLGYVQ